jgi:hypothetical protein
MKHNPFPLDIERMSCIRPTLKTCDHIITGSEVIDNFSFALVTPLQSQKHINHVNGLFEMKEEIKRMIQKN